MRFTKLITSLISAMCIMAGMAGTGITALAADDLSTQITVYVTDNDGIPADGTHQFILSDGNEQRRTLNSGNTAMFTVTLPAGQDVKTVMVYEEPVNPSGYDYDGSVYGISLVANYDHTSLDSVDITKDGIEYTGSIYFANRLHMTTPTPVPTATPTTTPQTQPATQTNPATNPPTYVDQNGNPVQNQPVTNSNTQQDAQQNTSEFVADNNIYERENVVYGRAITMDTNSTTIRDDNGLLHTVYDSNVKIATVYNLNDEVTLAYNGNEESMRDAVIGKNLRVLLIRPSTTPETKQEPEKNESETSPTPEPTEKPATPEPTVESTGTAEPVVVQKKKSSPAILWIILGAGAVGAAMLTGVLIGSRKKNEDMNSLDNEPEYEDDSYNKPETDLGNDSGYDLTELNTDADEKVEDVSKVDFIKADVPDEGSGGVEGEVEEETDNNSDDTTDNDTDYEKDEETEEDEATKDNDEEVIKNEEEPSKVDPEVNSEEKKEGE